VNKATGNQHRGTLGISGDLLVDGLRLPTDVTILDAQWDASSHALYLVVEHPDLPAVPETERPPVVKARFKASEDEAWVFDSWECEYR
jgi:hypothetical protein